MPDVRGAQRHHARYDYDPASGALASYKRGIESSVTLTYDAKGRIQTAGAMRYSHDPLGRRNYSGPSSEPSQTTYGWQGERLTTQSGAGWSARRDRPAHTLGHVRLGGNDHDLAYEGIRLTGLDAVRDDGSTWALEYLCDEKGTVTGGI